MSYSKSTQNTSSLADLMKRGPKAKVNNEAPKPKDDGKGPAEYPRMNLSVIGKDLTSDHLAKKLLDITRSNIKGVSVAVFQPQKSLRIPFKNGSFKYSSPSIRNPPDSNMYQRLMANKLSHYARPTETMIRSNGTRLGLSLRMSQQLIIRNPNYSTPDRMILEMRRMLPIRKIEDSLFPKNIDINHDCFQKLNTKACAGFPYAFEVREQEGLKDISDDTYLKLEYSPDLPQVGKQVIPPPVPLNTEPMMIIEHALYWAKKIFKVVDDGANLKDALLRLSNFFDRHPDLKTFMLKRKDEKHERDEMLTKVRPYGVQPLPARFYCMWAMSVIEQNILNFVDDPSSISAYHFSQFYGGAERLLNHFEVNKDQFVGLSYGDDQLWMIRLEDDTVVFLTPDVKAMDMNTSSESVISHCKYLKTAIPNLPDVNFRAFAVAMTMAFNHQVFVDGTAVLSKTESLFSGVPGTTVINIVNSAKIQAWFKEGLILFRNKYGSVTKENFFKCYAFCLDYVTSKTGYKFKGLEGFSVTVANKNFTELCDLVKDQVYFDNFKNLRTNGIPLPFLSNKVAIIDGRPVCVPYKLEKFGASLVLPSAVSMKAGVKSQIERVVGVAFSGGWVDPVFFKGLQDIFSSLRNSNNSYFGVDDVGSGGEQDVLEVVKIIAEGNKNLPSREFFLDMNTMSKEDFAIKHLVEQSMEPHVEDESSSSSSSSSGEKKETRLEVGRGGYADLMEAADDLEGYNPKLLSVPPIPKYKMGNFNALDAQDQELKIKKMKARWALDAARKFVADNTTGKARKKLEGMLDDSNDDFTLSDLQESIDNLFDQEDEEYMEFQDALRREEEAEREFGTWKQFDFSDDDVELQEHADKANEDEDYGLELDNLDNDQA